jgi:hypothetical protein
MDRAGLDCARSDSVGPDCGEPDRTRSQSHQRGEANFNFASMSAVRSLYIFANCLVMKYPFAEFPRTCSLSLCWESRDFYY